MYMICIVHLSPYQTYPEYYASTETLRSKRTFTELPNLKGAKVIINNLFLFKYKKSI